MASAIYRVIANKAAGGVRASEDGHKTTIATQTYADLSYETVRTLSGAIICGLVGATAARPAGASAGQLYIDTTLSKVVFSDGAGNWHDPFTGGIV
jgi:hypothetical protein